MNLSKSQRIREVAAYFLKLGLTAFGGPAAHIAMMREEVVKRRNWMDDRQYLDLLGATQLIPGPNSTEMAIFIGFFRAGCVGLILGGLCFILPAAVMVTVLAWLYVRFGQLPEVGSFFYGMTPVIVVIILQAVFELSKHTVKGPFIASVGIASIVLFLSGLNPVLILLVCGLLVLSSRYYRRLRNKGTQAWAFFLSGGTLSIVSGTSFSLPLLFLIFLKIGAVLFGSGYVLLAFLRADFVENLRWLTDKQLIDAVAIGQATPGPVFTTATFIGFLLGGIPGALVATLGIFLPSFLFVAVMNPIIPRLRHSPILSGFLDGVNIASLGLMAGVAWQLCRSSLIDPFSVTTAIISLWLLFQRKINSTWLILAGGMMGLLSSVILALAYHVSR